MQRNDCIIAALGTGHINDLLLSYYQANGATSDDLNTAEAEFLAAESLVISGDNNDWWSEFWCWGGWALTPELFDFVTDLSFGEAVQDSGAEYSVFETTVESGYKDATTLTIGLDYDITYQVWDYVEGDIRIGDTAGTLRTADGQYTERVTADTTDLVLTCVTTPSTMKFRVLSARLIP